MRTVGTLYFLAGKMGAGKSTFSVKYSEENSAVLISEDEWLSALYPDEIHDFDDFIVRHNKLLSTLKPHVQNILKAGASVILDFPANTLDSRRWYLELASEVGAGHKMFYLDVSDEICLSRIEKRRVEQPERSKFDTPEVFKHVTGFFEEPTKSEGLNVEVLVFKA